MRVAQLVTEITGNGSFPAKGTLPAGKTLSGTFSSVGTVVTGTNTKFKSEIGSVKAYLYSTTDNELRAFTQINGDNILELEKAFTNNQTNENLIVCFPLYTAIAAKSSHATLASTLNGKTFPAGATKNFYTFAGVNPITYDAGSGEITFDLSY